MGLKQTNSQHWEGALNKKLFAIVNCWQRENIFFSVECHWIHTSTTFQGRPHTQKKLANVNWSPGFSCAFYFVLVFLSYCFCNLFVLIFTCLFLFFFLREKEHEVGHLQMWQGYWRNWGGKGVCSKYILWKQQAFNDIPSKKKAVFGRTQLGSRADWRQSDTPLGGPQKWSSTCCNKWESIDIQVSAKLLSI